MTVFVMYIEIDGALTREGRLEDWGCPLQIVILPAHIKSCLFAELYSLSGPPAADWRRFGLFIGVFLVNRRFYAV